uniref:Auxin response factor 3a n=1 Tax=Lotus japonicus TaxID=34305 RepID=D3GBU6_LOTJA|nr:auxin response factor 3a [Lotus japonicus]
MAGLIDLNTAEDDETPSSGGSSSTSATSMSITTATPSASSVCLELWHACAGPMICLPKKGSVVVYFPQGHLELVQDLQLLLPNIPPHVFCRVVDVKLHAEEGSDEVYCQVLLVPESEQVQQKLQEGEVDADGEEEEDTETMMKSSTPHMFCKTLTASDTSTHGGFSVPRRAAEDCFPPLDYSQQRPSQELVAKDLHGREWKFRHIYRGVSLMSHVWQPRRHLLTTGWSGFVNKKKLVSGDAVLFLRASSSEFIVPIHKFLKSLDYSYSAGMRFRMRFETDDAAERRCAGLIVGITDVDPVRWPGSKWKCLLVRWDDLEATRNNRVSPWEIEPSGSASIPNNLMAASLKRTRIGLPSTQLEFPVPNGMGASDFGESLRFQKVLQGQEISGVDTTFDGINAPSHQSYELRRCYPGSNYPGISSTGSSIRIPQMSSDVSYNSIGFSESFRFQKVLQGQEILPSQPYGGASGYEACGNGGFGVFDGYQVLRSRNGWSTHMNNHPSHLHQSVPAGQVSSPSSVLTFQQSINQGVNLETNNKTNQVMEGRVHHQGLYPSTMKGGTFVSTPSCEPSFRRQAQEDANSLGFINLHNQLDSSHSHDPISLLRGPQEVVSSCKSSCRVFGFSLTEGARSANEEADPSTVTCQLNPGTSFIRHVEDDFRPRHSLRSKAVGKYCSKEVLQY